MWVELRHRLRERRDSNAKSRTFRWLHVHQLERRWLHTQWTYLYRRHECQPDRDDDLHGHYPNSHVDSLSAEDWIGIRDRDECQSGWYQLRKHLRRVLPNQ